MLNQELAPSPLPPCCPSYFWTAFSVVMPEPPAESLTWVEGAAKVKRITLPVSILVGITAFSGAFVAGNDAGRAFNTFPKMGDYWIPEDIPSMKPLFRNFFENTATVQDVSAIIGNVTILANHSEEVDFTHPFAESGLSMIVKVKQDMHKAWMFLKPFTKNMWLATFSIMFYSMFVV